MPHLTLEYSANLDGHVDFATLLEVLRTTALATGIFPVAGVRIRAVRCDHFIVADGDPRFAFIDMALRMGMGRSEEQKKSAGAAIFAAAKRELVPLFESDRLLLALSLEIREINRTLSWRENPLHALMEAKYGHDKG